jgi:hypothetical protein
MRRRDALGATARCHYATTACARRHARWDRQRTRDNMQQTTCRMGTGDGQETTCDRGCGPCNMPRDDSQRPTRNVTSVRYATESVQQTRCNGQQCRRRQPSRARWQMRNRQQTTCTMQQTTCNGRHDIKHATDNIRTTCSGQYIANNRRNATDDMTLNMQ